jgi:hypothetical protein
MLRFIKLTVTLALLGGSLLPARAFSLLGTYETWQVAGLGYQQRGDIGGPMALGNGYRWNVPIITYAFDRQFMNYFGQRGVQEVEKAIQILNSLPAVSAMSTNLTEFPLDAKRVNHQAAALRILDLKSYSLGILLEELGLAQPERYAWCLRDRATYTVNTVTYTNYLVFQRNFDPVTWEPTKVVNGTMYRYQVQEPLQPGNYADAVEKATDPLALTYTSVASAFSPTAGGVSAGAMGLGVGQWYTGLTRDDAGGLRYLYRYNNYAMENAPLGVSNSLGSGTGGGYVIYFGTNFVGNTNSFYYTGATNTLVDVALRPGVDKISFQRVEYDSVYGVTLVPYYYDYNDTVVTNFTPTTQLLRRTITTPDILFTVDDLGIINDGAGGLYPWLATRTAGMVNNAALNGKPNAAGPGVRQSPIVVTFSYLLPGFLNSSTDGNFYFDETNPNRTVIWGSFDGSTNTPIVYPNIYSIKDVEAQVLSGPRF